MSGVPRVRTDRGAILLEIVLSLGLFLATSMTLFIVVSGAVESLRRSRSELLAADHARNALAMIEAGIARPETLNGPVMPWSGSGDDLGLDADGGMGFGGPMEAGFPGSADGFEAADSGMGGEPIGGGLMGGAPGGDDLGWALEIETEPAEVAGLTLVVVRAYETDAAGGEAENGASYTLRQIMSLSGGSDDSFGDTETGGAP